MKDFLQKVNSYIKEAYNAGKYLYDGLSVTFDHLQRRPVTVQYPYEKLIPLKCRLSSSMLELILDHSWFSIRSII